MYLEDGRLPLSQLQAEVARLHREFGWKMVPIESKQGLSSFVFMTQQTGSALWILAGIHGEEPAGPNAIAQNVDVLAALGQQFPIVLFPLCNPWGYVKDWRYPNERRDWQKGTSVTDHEAFRAKVSELLTTYPPLLSIDHHEDEALPEGYIYSQGKLGVHDPVAREVVSLLEESGLPIQKTGVTRFGEKVESGIIGPVNDGSIDEFLANQSTKTVIVVETPTIRVPLVARIRAHSAIIQAYGDLVKLI